MENTLYAPQLSGAAACHTVLPRRHIRPKAFHSMNSILVLLLLRVACSSSPPSKRSIKAFPENTINGEGSLITVCDTAQWNHCVDRATQGHCTVAAVICPAGIELWTNLIRTRTAQGKLVFWNQHTVNQHI